MSAATVQRRPDVRYVTDWTAILDSLRRLGFTFQQLAQVLRIPKSTLINYRDGATPRHPEGEVLLSFYLHATLTERGAEPKRLDFPDGNARR